MYTYLSETLLTEKLLSKMLFAVGRDRHGREGVDKEFIGNDGL